MIYLDNAATTLTKPPEVKRAVIEAFDVCGNAGRGGYEGARKASEIVFEARLKAAELFGAEGAEKIVFTQNATHALNIAIKGLAKPGECVISGYEHNSVTRPLMSLASEGVKVTVARGRLFDCESVLREFNKMITRDTKLCVCTHVSNVFGFILPIKEIDYLCFKKGIPLIIDASQSAGAISVKLCDLRATECICAPGHKGLYGPQGTGILVCKNGEGMKTLIQGGTGSNSESMYQPEFLPDRFESGTQNIPGIAGLSEGISYVQKRGVKNIFNHERSIMNHLIAGFSKMPEIYQFAASDRGLQSGVLSFVVKGIDSEKVAELLDEEKIAVRSGKHCAPIAHRTVGTENGTVRVSASDFTDVSDIDALISSMKKIVRKVL